MEYSKASINTTNGIAYNNCFLNFSRLNTSGTQLVMPISRQIYMGDNKRLLSGSNREKVASTGINNPYTAANMITMFSSQLSLPIRAFQIKMAIREHNIMHEI